MEFLSPEWLLKRFQLATSQRWLPDVNVRIQHVVISGPRGAVHYFDDVMHGVLVRSELGMIEHPHVTITNLWSDELAVMLGDLGLFDVLMSGRVSVDGDQGRLFALLPVLVSDEVAQLARSLALEADIRNRAEAS